MKARDDEARELVADAVVAEMREVLSAAGLVAEVSVFQPQGPVFAGGVAYAANYSTESGCSHRATGPNVVIDLAPGDAALLAQLVRAASDG